MNTKLYIYFFIIIQINNVKIILKKKLLFYKIKLKKKLITQRNKINN